MKKVLLLICIITVLALVGCGKRQVVTDPDTLAGTETEATDTAEAGKAGEAGAAGEGAVTSEDISREAETAETAEGTSPLGVGREIFREILDITFEDILFDFDMYDIKPEYRPVLMEISDWLISNEAVILIEGHCDERGTNEYNLALGDRRAKSTRDFLMASGVPSRKIEYLSYGEERPVCTDQGESCWSRNRRAHFTVGTK